MNRFASTHRILILLLACFTLLIVAGCNLTIEPPPSAATATPPVDSQPAGQAEMVGMVVRQALQQQLQLDAGQVEIVAVEPVEWSDACLGAARAEEMCAQVVTPGYRVLLTANGQEYQFHTNAEASAIRLVAAPPVATAEAVLAWRSPATAAPCQNAFFSSQVMAWGDCGAVLAQASYALPERAVELAEFVQDYGQINAETLAGTIILTGSGGTEPTPAEARMIAEWARLVALEASGGRSGASWGLALAWHREGGIAGFCDDLTVYVTGMVYAATCRGQTPVDLGHTRLEPEQLATLYGWIDQWQGFELEARDSAVADALTQRLIFSGAGSATATPADQQEILNFAQDLYNQLAGNAGGIITTIFRPLASEQCEAIRSTIEDRLGVPVVRAETPALFESIVGGAGESCRLSASGTVVEFADFVSYMDVASAVVERLAAQGWGQDPQYAADGPTATITGLRRDEALAVVRVDWGSAPGVECPDDQPIASCAEQLSLDQIIYAVTIDLVETDSQR